MPKFVTKADGSKEAFDKEKIVNTAIRTGLEPRVARRIADKLEAEAPEGVSTHKLYEMLFEELEKVNVKSAALFGLRESIADMDSRSFEIYSMKVLEANGYQCEWDRIIKGRSVEHQVDIIAKKDSQLWLVECKRHFNPHRFTGLDVALQVHARLEDLQDGFVAGMNKYSFSGAWIFTNTKFSQHAIDYSSAKNTRMTGWRSGEFGLEKLAEPQKIFPVTILKADLAAKTKMLESGIITIHDLVQSKKALVPNWQMLVAQAKQILK